MLKLEELILRKNPIINFNEDINGLDSSDKLNLHRDGHKFAFAAIRQKTGSSRIDPRYVKFMVLLDGLIETRYGSKKYYKPIQFHECTEAELREFAPATQDSQGQFEYYVTSVGLEPIFCVDVEKDIENLEMWGSFESNNFQTISINLVPCNFAFPTLEEFYPTSDECVKDE